MLETGKAVMSLSFKLYIHCMYFLIFVIYFMIRHLTFKKLYCKCVRAWCAWLRATGIGESTSKAEVNQTLCFSPFHLTVLGIRRSLSMQ